MPKETERFNDATDNSVFSDQSVDRNQHAAFVTEDLPSSALVQIELLPDEFEHLAAQPRVL